MEAGGDFAAAAIANRAGRWLAGAGLVHRGGLGSALGFVLPLFRVSRSYPWWYGGWHLLTINEPDLWWIRLLFLGYAIFRCAGFMLPCLDALAIGLLAALAAADAVTALGRVYRLDLIIGLFVVLPAHGTMLIAGLAALILQLARELVGVGAITAPASVAAPRHELADHVARP